MIIRLTVTLEDGDKHMYEMDTDTTDRLEIITATENGDVVALVEIDPGE